MSDRERILADRISAHSLEGHLSFIASDLLNGRDTPSPGLDLAAEYIAAQFRRAGLKPFPDGSYFQTAEMAVTEQKLDTFSVTLQNGKQITRGMKLDVQLLGMGPLSLMNLPVYRANAFTDLTPVDTEGKALLISVAETTGTDQEKMSAVFRLAREARGAAKKLKPAALIVVIPMMLPPRPDRTVSDPETTPTGDLPVVFISGADWKAAAAALPLGQTQATLSLAVPAPERTVGKAKNVIGLLPGSDPVLKNTYVLVTAHYDHLGVGSGSGDVIFNGANDDGSGTVSVIELASALASMDPKPKRSIVFMTYFGEEKGLLGSRYYGRHPAFALKQTVADINLEQVGRTDEAGGAQTGSASLTGYDFSNVTDYFVTAGEKTGVRVYRHPVNSDMFFGRSDNQALADAGVPAHTMCTSFEFGDYHKVGDEWNKVDYANMEKVDRMVAVAVEELANSEKAPQWNAANPKTAKYVEASKKLIGE